MLQLASLTTEVSDLLNSDEMYVNLNKSFDIQRRSKISLDK